MKLIDLTHSIEPGMPVFPGTRPPVLEQSNRVEIHGFAEKLITFFSHTGTHMDAPSHMLLNGKTLDEYSIADFYGKAVLLDVSGHSLTEIGLEFLLPLQEQLQGAQFLIIRTGWDRYWGQPKFFEDYPALSPEAARWAIHQGIKAVGTDAISVDRITNLDFTIHHLLFNAGCYIIENLDHLDQLSASFTLGCFPLNTQDADGAPTRAVAFLDSNVTQ